MLASSLFLHSKETKLWFFLSEASHLRYKENTSSKQFIIMLNIIKKQYTIAIYCWYTLHMSPTLKRDLKNERRPKGVTLFNQYLLKQKLVRFNLVFCIVK